MSDETAIHRAGDVRIVGVTIIGGSGVILDVSPQLLSLELVENMFEPFTTGILTLSDSIELTNILPIVGREIVTISFYTPALGDKYKYDRTFCVYNSTDKIKNTERNSIYQLRIISQEAFIDKAMRVSKTFRGTPSDIARALTFEDGLQSKKQFYGEISKNEVTFISNWWNPTKCLRYLCSRALNANNSATYLFFETNSGFNFITLDTLFRAPTFQSFFVNDYSVNPTESYNSTSSPDINADYQTVLQIRYDNGFDVFERLSTGFYGGEVIGFDGNTGQYVHTRAGNNFENEHHLNKYTSAPSNSFVSTSSYIQYIPYVSQNFTGQNRGVFDSDLTFRTARQQFLSRLNTNKATIQVYGRCDYFPGMVVYLSVPKDGQITANTKTVEDQLISGRYVVSSIKHIITVNRHVATLELMKDSYITDVTRSTIDTQTNDNSTKSGGSTGNTN